MRRRGLVVQISPDPARGIHGATGLRRASSSGVSASPMSAVSTDPKTDFAVQILAAL